jgi:hypothetical protein
MFKEDSDREKTIFYFLPLLLSRIIGEGLPDK